MSNLIIGIIIGVVIGGACGVLAMALVIGGTMEK